MSHIDDCSDANSSAQDCIVAKTIRVIGSKWSMHIIHYLFDGTRRFGEIQRYLGAVSPKTLTQRLVELEKDGIITRKVFAEVPLRVEYSLTTKGKSLKGVFDEMSQWAKRVIPQNQP